MDAIRENPWYSEKLRFSYAPNPLLQGELRSPKPPPSGRTTFPQTPSFRENYVPPNPLLQGELRSPKPPPLKL